MKVGTQQGDHQSGTGTKVLINQGQPIDNITINVSALNPPYLLLRLSLALMMAVKVTFVYHNPPPVTENQSISSQVRTKV